MNSEFSDELISAYLDNEVSPAERTLVERMLRERPECQQTLDELRALQARLRELPPVEPRHDVMASVLRRAERAALEPASALAARPRNSVRNLWLAIGTVAASVGVLWFAFQGEDKPLTVAQNDPQEALGGGSNRLGASGMQDEPASVPAPAFQKELDDFAGQIPDEKTPAAMRRAPVMFAESETEQMSAAPDISLPTVEGNWSFADLEHAPTKSALAVLPEYELEISAADQEAMLAILNDLDVRVVERPASPAERSLETRDSLALHEKSHEKSAATAAGGMLRKNATTRVLGAPSEQRLIVLASQEQLEVAITRLKSSAEKKQPGNLLAPTTPAGIEAAKPSGEGRLPVAKGDRFSEAENGKPADKSKANSEAGPIRAVLRIRLRQPTER